MLSHLDYVKVPVPQKATLLIVCVCCVHHPQVSIPEKVLGLAWAGRAVFIAVPGGYKVLHGNKVVNIAEHLLVNPMLAPIPSLNCGVLLWDDNMALVTDPNGVAVREPLLLPMTPLAVAHAGLFIVAMCDDGVHVFDRGSSKEVQHIDWAHDDAYVGLTKRLPCADDMDGRCIVMATAQEVFLLEPIALEQQVGLYMCMWGQNASTWGFSAYL